MLAHLAGGAWVSELVQFADGLVAAVHVGVRAGRRACPLPQCVDVCMSPRAGRTRKNRVKGHTQGRYWAA